MLEISGGNWTWSTSQDPVVIRDSLQPVKIELETSITVNTLYTATVTVFTDYANISSSQEFSVYNIVNRYDRGEKTNVPLIVSIGFQPPEVVMDGPTSSKSKSNLMWGNWL